ncbi:ABC transporter ATP-binding protein [Kytococcus sp. HMSC28H12]|uniref:ABC transporter ATP-binding protein n=1 Tax=Kytococcus TaxID=57499 RepID=UPI0008A6321B|nr:ABC transporter ATP-binding protein [Kytococcus sp. HMSC28H12]OFS08074.1 ABC transporter ATP-binding protein [Kytococcus sp. HMSC28H12]
MPTTSPAAVLFDDVALTREGVRALDGLSFTAPAGAVTCVLGRNGAGKSTMVQTATGLLRADSGVVRVLGTDPWGATPEHRGRVSVALQDGGLPTGVRPSVLLAHLSRLYPDPRPWQDLWRRLGIHGYDRRIIRRLSGGQRQRVALAAALVGRPQVTFLDEPTAGLDPHSRLDVWDVVRRIAQEGVAVVVTTHSFEEAERLADRVVVIDAGRCVAQGPVAEVADGSTLEERFFALTGRTETEAA